MMRLIISDKLLFTPHVDTATFVSKIPKNQGFSVKNASNVLVNTIELHRLFVKIVKINRFHLFIPFSFLDHIGPRYVCA